MKSLKDFWKETEKFLEKHEQEIVDKLIHFLREVAKVYLKEGRKVFFHENKVVHYGEGGFGTLLIEGEEDEFDVFGDYISDIRFEHKIDEEYIRRGYIEIKENNIGAIKYALHS